MNVKPDEYDLSELRRISREVAPDDGADAGRDRPRRSDGQGGPRTGGETNGNGSFAFGEVERRDADETVRSNQLEQLFLHQSSDDQPLRKPYLERLPDQYAAEKVVFDWLEYLVLKAGFKRSFEAVRYYQNIDWITPEVEDDLQEYLLGFSADVEHTEELVLEDHHLSLVYLARLASMA